MAKTNVPRARIHTYEGAPAKHIGAEAQLRRSIMSCLLWEDQFYEDGVSIAKRVAQLVPQVDPLTVSGMAIQARDKMHLRHVPLWIVREMARHDHQKHLVASTLNHIIQRADELAEFVALYWRDGKQPLSAQVKKGLAQAFPKFDAYQLAKYNRDGAVKLRDVLFLCHAQPKDKEQEATWKKLVEGTLEPPDTWEVKLSATKGEGKQEAWEDLLQRNKLGAMALLRNLRNFEQEGVSEELVTRALANAKVQRILPFRFIAAARHAPQWEDKIESLMLKSLEKHERLPGRTILLVDRSGSMSSSLSGRSQMSRIDAACGLAILLREVCEDIRIFSFHGEVFTIPPRRGFALRDAIGEPCNGTYLGQAVRYVDNSRTYDRFIVITDEQTHDPVPDPKGKAYMINVASYQNGVGYGPWTHIDGWSEAIVDFILELERSGS